MIKKILWLFIFTLFLNSCSHITEPPFEHQYVIYLSLKPQEHFQRAFVDSTYRINVSVDSESTGISGAEIFVLNTNGDTFRFYESDSIKGLYYSNDTSWVNYASNYLVNVVIGNDTICEAVSVPDTLTIHLPHTKDTISLNNSPPVIWNNCNGCYKHTYFVYAYITGTLDSIDYHMVTTDTVMNIFLARDLFSETDTTYTVCIIGYDENNYNASFRGNTDQIEDNRAIGTIGATVLDSIVVWVTE
ncbi:MAG: hypothetical protein B5M53_11365 [Candidatus Cloacimonas sp. 4484_209]|nr:MAG: hypothetical protein B5M53_11365 [Candidatus Cloacimonas sp. 4484_209]